MHRKARDHPRAYRASTSFGLLFKPPVGLVHNLVGKRKNPVPHLRVFLGRMASREKPVVGVEGCVQQILPVKFLENHRLEQQHSPLRIARMSRVKPLNRSIATGKSKL